MPTRTRPLLDETRNNKYDAEKEWTWGGGDEKDPRHFRRTYTLRRYQQNGFAVFGLVAAELDVVKKLEPLIMEFGEEFFDLLGSSVFNTMQTRRREALAAKERGKWGVDVGRDMVTEASLSEPSRHLSRKVDAARVKVIALIAQFTELVQPRLKAELGCDEIQGSIFAILRSIWARAQLLHCDLEYNENTTPTFVKYDLSQILGLVSFFDDTCPDGSSSPLGFTATMVVFSMANPHPAQSAGLLQCFAQW